MNLRRMLLFSYGSGYGLREFRFFVKSARRNATGYRELVARRVRKREKRLVDREIRSYVPPHHWENF